jgi:hypothetical protein
VQQKCDNSIEQTNWLNLNILVCKIKEKRALSILSCLLLPISVFLCFLFFDIIPPKYFPKLMSLISESREHKQIFIEHVV